MFSAFQNLTESPILAMVMVDHQHVLKVATQQNLQKSMESDLAYISKVFEYFTLASFDLIFFK